MFDKLVAVGTLIFQVCDFAIKAVMHFTDTPEGAKEFADVQAALVELGLLDVPTAPAETASTQTTSLFDQLVENGNGEFDAAELRAEIARQSEERQRVGANVFRAPKRHPEGEGS